jgi:hypothetical protein
MKTFFEKFLLTIDLRKFMKPHFNNSDHPEVIICKFAANIYYQIILEKNVWNIPAMLSTTTAILGIDFIQLHSLTYCPEQRTFYWKGGTHWNSGTMKLCSMETMPSTHSLHQQRQRSPSPTPLPQQLPASSSPPPFTKQQTTQKKRGRPRKSFDFAPEIPLTQMLYELRSRSQVQQSVIPEKPALPCLIVPNFTLSLPPAQEGGGIEEQNAIDALQNKKRKKRSSKAWKTIQQRNYAFSSDHYILQSHENDFIQFKKFNKMNLQSSFRHLKKKKKTFKTLNKNLKVKKKKNKKNKNLKKNKKKKKKKKRKKKKKKRKKKKKKKKRKKDKQ